MRNLILMILFTCIFCACTSDAPETTVRTQTAADGDLISKPAFACYGVIAGLAMGLVLSRKWAASNKRPGRRRGNSPGPQLPRQTQFADSELEHKFIKLEEELKRCRYQNEAFKRELDEALKFSTTEITQNIKPAKDIRSIDTQANEGEAIVTGITTIYYLQPSADGRFKEMSKVNTAADALYELCYQNNNPDEASLKFIDSSGNAFLAIQNEQTWILVACERSNIPSDHTHSVRTDKPGKAVRKNGEWEILEKAKITYI
jgi:hypothetical protein